MTQFNSPSKEAIERSFGTNDDALLAAMAAAFGLIACSDAVLEQCETERFFEIVRTSDSLSKLPWDHIESQFERVTNDILKQGAAGREAALASVAAVKADNAHRDAVIACARIAVVSNFQVQDVEERALKEVCTALGVQPDDI